MGLAPQCRLSTDILNTGIIFSNTRHNYDVELSNCGDIVAEYVIVLPNTEFSQFIDIRPRAGRLEVDERIVVQLVVQADRLGDFVQLIVVSVNDMVLTLRYHHNIFVNSLFVPLMPTVAIWVQLDSVIPG